MAQKKSHQKRPPAPGSGSGSILLRWLGHGARVLVALIALAATAFALETIPLLLHPLFGGIAVRLYLGTARSLAMFAGAGGGFLLLERTLKRRDHSLEGSLAGFALVLFAVPFLVRSLAVAGGEAWGPRYGPLAPLGVLMAGVTAGGMWALMACVSPLVCGSEVADEPRRHDSVRKLAFTNLLLLKAVQRAQGYWPESMQLAPTEGSICQVALAFAGLAVIAAVCCAKPAIPASESAGHFKPARLALLTISLLALQRRLFALPITPYDAIPGQLKILHVAHSVTGLIVVGENVKDGYRFLRCDHSLLGGRFLGRTQRLQGELGDSIFSTFVLQEAVRLATPPRRLEDGDAKPQTLVIGLGAGIAADAMTKHGHDVDIVEIDPEVYWSARRHLGLSAASRSVELSDAAGYVRALASNVSRQGASTGRISYDYVIHDCFTGGSVPHEVFTVEFWDDLKNVIEPDAVVAVNFAGTMDSMATTTVMRTLIAAFDQCRAFTDAHGSQDTQTGKELMNLVIFCTPSGDRELDFRPVEEEDLLGSEIRRRVMSDFTIHEMALARWQAASHHDLLRRGAHDLDVHQVDSALGTWHAMRNIMSVDMWRAY